ncbi:hypothetical protein ABTL68_19255, partial [Acinetobacter baumannii]
MAAAHTPTSRESLPLIAQTSLSSGTRRIFASYLNHRTTWTRSFVNRIIKPHHSVTAGHHIQTAQTASDSDDSATSGQNP